MMLGEDPKWKYVVMRSCRYLNNIVSRIIVQSNVGAPG
jgi:hypothetical protein